MYFVFASWFEQKGIQWAIFDKTLNSLLESGIIFNTKGPISIKKLLKALAILVWFGISLRFSLTMFGRALRLYFSVIIFWILLHVKMMLLRFLSFWKGYNKGFDKIQPLYFRNNLSLFHTRCLIYLFIHDFDCSFEFC